MQGLCRCDAAGGDRRKAVGRVSTAVPGVERAPNPVATRTCGTWNPDGVRPLAPRTGKPTARKAQFPSGEWMTQEANADGRKATGNLDTTLAPPPTVPDNWPDTDICPTRKGADVGQVGL